MNRLLILGVVLIGAATYWWNGRVDMGKPSVNGFIAVTMPDGAAPNTVVIFAPLNCPSDAAQRAAQLSEELTRQGIPNVRSNSFSADLVDPTREQRVGLERAVVVMNGAIPAVFVNGMARANPTADQVAAEYQRTKG
jgi:hypothetical protein